MNSCVSGCLSDLSSLPSDVSASSFDGSSVASSVSSSSKLKSGLNGCQAAWICGMFAIVHWSRTEPSEIGFCGPNTAIGWNVLYLHTENEY